MGAWLVEYLLKNQYRIREHIIEVHPPGHYFSDYYNEMDIDLDSAYNTNLLIVTYSFEDETYNDLLQVEKAIENLRADKKLTNLEYKIILMMEDSIRIEKMEKILKLDKRTIHKIFSNVCERIAYILGGYFTNEGFIDRICRRKKLTEEQVQKIRNYFMKNTLEKFL